MGIIALILAQRGPVEIDNWIEIIVLILVFGGTIFAAIAKKLIAMFSPDETGATKDGPLGVEGDDVTPVSPPRPARPAYPVARPMPPRPGAPTTSAPPMMQPSPSRPRPRPVTEVTPEEPAWRPPVEAQRTPPVPQPSVRRRPAPPPRARPAQPIAVAEREPVEDTFEHLHPEEDPGHLDPKAHPEHVAATLQARAADIPAAAPMTVGPLTRESLRRAIVMNEILGLPRALRDFDEPR